MEGHIRPDRHVTKNGKHVIKIAFFSSRHNNNSSSSSSCMDWLAACWTRRKETQSNRATVSTFTHVEFRFSDGAVTSITRAHPSVMHLIPGKMLSNAGYRCFYQLYVTPRQETVMRRYAESCVDDHVPFNARAFWWNFAPITQCCPIRARGNAYFCSEYVTELLQFAFRNDAQIGALDAACTTPNMLYDALKASDAAVLTINRELLRFQKKEGVGERRKKCLISFLDTLGLMCIPVHLFDTMVFRIVIKCPHSYSKRAVLDVFL